MSGLVFIKAQMCSPHPQLLQSSRLLLRSSPQLTWKKPNVSLVSEVVRHLSEMEQNLWQSCQRLTSVCQKIMWTSGRNTECLCSLCRNTSVYIRKSLRHNDWLMLPTVKRRQWPFLSFLLTSLQPVICNVQCFQLNVAIRWVTTGTVSCLTI